MGLIIAEGTCIASGGLDRDSANALLERAEAQLVAFGRPVIANPDFAERLAQEEPLNEPDASTFYTPGERRYTDCPELAATDA